MYQYYLLPIFSMGWHDARFAPMIRWMKMKMINENMMVKMKMKMNGKMNGKYWVVCLDLKE